MKITFYYILLAVLYTRGYAVYEYDAKAIPTSNTDFSDDLNVQAALNAEYNADLLHNMQTDLSGNDKRSETKTNSDSNTLPELANIENFVGTNLFDGARKKCFSTDDVALLAARQDFEMLLPKDLEETLLYDEMVTVLMQYFYNTYHVIQRLTDQSIKNLTEKAFYDALGGYLKSHMVPMVKYAYYSGRVGLKPTVSVISLYEQCKKFLNTNGNGWKAPVEELTQGLSNMQAEPLNLETSDTDNSALCCSNLEICASNSNSGETDQMLVPLPRLDPEDSCGFLTNIWFPYKNKNTFNLRAETSAFVVVKFYEAVTRCYSFKGLCQTTYNQKFKCWLTDNVQVHLTDEQFYPGFGSILRVFENLRRGKKAANYENQHEETEQQHNEYDFNDNEEKNALEELTENVGLNADTNQFAAKAVAPADNKIINIDTNTALDTDVNLNLNLKDQIPLLYSSNEGQCSHKSKPKCGHKTKLKSKHKCQQKPFKCNLDMTTPKLTLEPTSENSTFLSRFYGYFSCLKNFRFWWILVVTVIILFLIFLLCLALCRLRRRKDARDYTSKTGQKIRDFFKKLFGRKSIKAPDEEGLIKPESKSIISGSSAISKYCRLTSSTSSSLTCQPRLKCMPFMKKPGRGNSTPRSLMSSSSREQTPNKSERATTKKTRKHPAKVVTINEKRNKKEKPSKTKEKHQRSKSPAESSDQCKDELTKAGKMPKNIQSDKHSSSSKERSPKRKSKHTTSWDTMFSS